MNRHGKCFEGSSATPPCEPEPQRDELSGILSEASANSLYSEAITLRSEANGHSHANGLLSEAIRLRSEANSLHHHHSETSSNSASCGAKADTKQRQRSETAVNSAAANCDQEGGGGRMWQGEHEIRSVASRSITSRSVSPSIALNGGGQKLGVALNNAKQERWMGSRKPSSRKASSERIKSQRGGFKKILRNSLTALGEEIVVGSWAKKGRANEQPARSKSSISQRTFPVPKRKGSKGSSGAADSENASVSNAPKSNASNHGATILLEDFPLDDDASRSIKRRHSSMSDMLEYPSKNSMGRWALELMPNEDFQHDDSRRQSSMTEMASSGGKKRFEGHARSVCSHSSMMADYIALKLKVAELQSELQVLKNQGLQEAQETMKKLEERNSQLEEENFMLLKLLANLERLGMLKGAEEDLASLWGMRDRLGTIDDDAGLDEEEHGWRRSTNGQKGNKGWKMSNLNGSDWTPYERKKGKDKQRPMAIAAAGSVRSVKNGNHSWLSHSSSNFFTYSNSTIMKSSIASIHISSGRSRTSNDGSMILVQNMPLKDGTHNDGNMIMVQNMPLKDTAATPDPYCHQMQSLSSVTTPPVRQQKHRRPSLIETIKNLPRSLSMPRMPEGEGACDSIQEYRLRRERKRRLLEQVAIDGAAAPSAVPEYVQCLDGSTTDTRCSELTLDVMLNKRWGKNGINGRGAHGNGNAGITMTLSMSKSWSCEDLPEVEVNLNEDNSKTGPPMSGGEAESSSWRHSSGQLGYSAAQETHDGREYQVVGSPGMPDRKRPQRAVSSGSGEETLHREEKKDGGQDSEQEHWNPSEYAFSSVGSTASCE